MAANVWENILKNVESDNNEILYETLLDFFTSKRYFLNKPRIKLFVVMFRRYTTYKPVVLLQLVILGYMFRPLPGHHQTNKEIVLIKVHLLVFSNGIPLVKLMIVP